MEVATDVEVVREVRNKSRKVESGIGKWKLETEKQENGIGMGSGSESGKKEMEEKNRQEVEVGKEMEVGKELEVGREVKLENGIGTCIGNKEVGNRTEIEMRSGNGNGG